MIAEKEIRVVGLSRSGNHAVINWILKQHNTEHIFINAVLPFQDPFDFTAEAKRDTSLLLYTYENVPVDYVTSREFEKAKRDSYAIKAKNTYVLLILRHPLNLFASRYKSGIKGPSSRILNETDLWIMHAKWFLSKRQHNDINTIFINFDKWVACKQYRAEIINSLGITFSDEGKEDVSQYGGGSSFDGLDYDKKASKMNILNRWQDFSGQQAYERIIQNKALLDLAERIFEYDQQTRQYIQSLKGFKASWKGYCSTLKVLLAFRLLKMKRSLQFSLYHK